MGSEKEILSASEMEGILTRLTFQILETCPNLNDLAIVGIRRGGAFMAERIAEKISSSKGAKVNFGLLDITLYRDDLSEIANYPVLHGTEIDFDINGKTLVLVDDVLFTGRTVRAALDALTDLGRPKKTQLAVFVDRGHRELPIQADFIGKEVPTSLSEIVHVKFVEKDGEDSVTIGQK
jgi:pyrimidine operon attenuation protein/uracil phosphoribosyltransferase